MESNNNHNNNNAQLDRSWFRVAFHYVFRHALYLQHTFHFLFVRATFSVFHSLAIRYITGNTRCRLRSHKCKSTHRPDVTAFIQMTIASTPTHKHTEPASKKKKNSATKFEVNETIKTKIEKNTKWSHTTRPKINDFSFLPVFFRTWYGNDYGDMHAHIFTSTHIFFLYSLHALVSCMQFVHCYNANSTLVFSLALCVA